MKTKKQILLEYGPHLGGDILKELNGVGIKRDSEGDSLFFDEDVHRAEESVMNKR